MKTKILKKFFTLLLILIIMFVTNVNAQVPDPPSNHGYNGNPKPGASSAPIGSGLFILLGLGAAYGGKKIYDARKNNND